MPKCKPDRKHVGSTRKNWLVLGEKKEIHVLERGYCDLRTKIALNPSRFWTLLQIIDAMHGDMLELNTANN